tara:strand:+ start:292 stop:615 length:324 start_codon:yes stop_codon:yes gene_type:complete
MRIDYVYKICTKKEWNFFKENKTWQGSNKDIEDGFIHLSNREQVNQTLKKYFSNQKDLVLLILKTDTLNNLIWEKSTNDEKFPHLYSKLQIENVLDSKEIIGDQYLF